MKASNPILHIFSGKHPLFLGDLSIPDQLCTLVLAPHPDDFDEIGITLRFFRENGNPIHVAVVSSGASGVEDGFCSPSDPKTKAELREREQQESCRFFGLSEGNLRFLRLEEDETGTLLESQENCDMIRQHLQRIRPDIVFLPHGNDTNLGHKRTYAMFRKATSSLDYPIMAFLNRDPKTIRMRHDLYTVFGEEGARWKARLLRFHQSQHQRNLNTRNLGFAERTLNINLEIARELSESENYAEVFELDFFGAKV